MKNTAKTMASAVYFTGINGVAVRREELSPGETEVLVESRLIGISHGTEMNIYRGTFSPGSLSGETISSLNREAAYPLKYGYMNAGITQEGKNVFAFFPHQDRFFCRPEDIVELPEDLSFDDAVFFANMETALGIVHDTHPHLAETGLVAGLGVVGLLVCELLLRSGTGRVFAVEPSLFRRQKARELGCIPLDPGTDDIRVAVLDATGGRGTDFAVNTSSKEDGLQNCIDTLSHEGRVIEASWYGDRRVTLTLGERFHRKRLTIQSSQVSHIGARLSASWDRDRRRQVTVDLLSSLHPSKYITHRFPLKDAALAFEAIHREAGEMIQAVLIP